MRRTLTLELGLLRLLLEQSDHAVGVGEQRVIVHDGIVRRDGDDLDGARDAARRNLFNLLNLLSLRAQPAILVVLVADLDVTDSDLVDGDVEQIRGGLAHGQLGGLVEAVHREAGERGSEFRVWNGAGGAEERRCIERVHARPVRAAWARECQKTFVYAQKAQAQKHAQNRVSPERALACAFLRRGDGGGEVSDVHVQNHEWRRQPLTAVPGRERTCCSGGNCLGGGRWRRQRVYRPGSRSATYRTVPGGGARPRCGAAAPCRT
jgi:hypothetical protein